MSKRCAIYCRVSTSKQEEDGTSLDTQREYSRKYAAARGYEVVAVYQDVHSGYDLAERPQVTKLREAVRQGGVDVVIAHAVDRLARNQAHLYILADEFERAGVGLEFVTESFEDSAVGKFLRSAKAFAAEVEREKIKERVTRGKRARIESGKIHSHSTELYGYRRDKAAGVRRIYEPEAEVVRRIFRWVGEEGRSIRSVIHELNNTGIPAPSEGKRNLGRKPYWGTGCLRRVLVNTAYKGETYAWHWTWEKQVRDGRQVRVLLERPESEWIKLPDGVTPAIVTAQLWDKVQNRLAVNMGEATRNEERPYLLRGLAVCSVCGRKMRANPEKGRRTYRCSSRETPSGPCGAKRVNADLLESFVWERMAEVLKDPRVILDEYNRRREAGTSQLLEADRDAAEKALTKVEGRLQRLIRLYADNENLALDTIKQELALADQEKRRLRATIDALNEQIVKQESMGTKWEELFRYCDEVAGQIDNFGFEQKRRALESWGVVVRASGRDWHIRFVVPGWESEPFEVKVRG